MEKDNPRTWLVDIEEGVREVVFIAGHSSWLPQGNTRRIVEQPLTERFGNVGFEPFTPSQYNNSGYKMYRSPFSSKEALERELQGFLLVMSDHPMMQGASEHSHIAIVATIEFVRWSSQITI